MCLSIKNVFSNFQVPLLLYSFFPCSVFVSRFVLTWLFFSLCLLCAQPQIQEDAVMGEINSLIVHLEQITKRPQSLPPDINIFHLWKSLQVSCIELSSLISKLIFKIGGKKIQWKIFKIGPRNIQMARIMREIISLKC